MKNKIPSFFKLYWIWILILVLVIGFAVSSVEIYKEEVLNIDPDVTYEISDTLYFPSESIDTLNPIISQSEDTYYISKLIYNSLFDYDESLNIVTELADEYTVNTERAFINIKLKDDVTWQNGNKFTAADVRFTVNTIKAAGSKSVYYKKASKISYVNVKSTHELDIYFSNNYNCSLDDLVFPIIPSSQYSTPLQFIGATDFKPIGTGQYAYKSYDYLKQLKLKPNKDYFGTVANNKINIEILPDKNLASNMMEIGSISCYTDDSQERRSVVTDGNLKMYNLPSNNVEFIYFNQKKALMKNKSIRQALAYSIDTAKIISNAYAGDCIASDTIYYPGFLGVKEVGTYYTYDLTKAYELLKSYGIEDRDKDGYVENSRGETVTISILVNKNNSMRNAAASIIQKNLSTAGFKVEVNALNRKDYLNALKTSDYDLVLMGYSMNEDYDLRDFFNGKNDWDYYNYKLFEEARQLDRLHEAQEYADIYAEFKEMLLDELPYYSICYKNMSLIGVTMFEAEKLPMFNDIYKNCDTWLWKY